jgi:hypothetical protein
VLVAGLDPTGNGGVVAGFGDLREIELLVEAGFTVDGVEPTWRARLSPKCLSRFDVTFD